MPILPQLGELTKVNDLFDKLNLVLAYS